MLTQGKKGTSGIPRLTDGSGHGSDGNGSNGKSSGGGPSYRVRNRLQDSALQHFQGTCRALGFDFEQKKGFAVKLQACADLPTRHGSFVIAAFSDSKTGKEHTALIKGDVSRMRDCPLRIHSQCHTGDVLGSLRCDCQAQLEASMKYIESRQQGVVIYLQQEGRGIGLVNKIRAYNLQDMGFDTVDANVCLGLPPDARDYGAASEIIQLLGIRSVCLLTNNPSKIEGLREHGIRVTRRMPLVIKANEHNREYLATKRKRMGHLF